jgi:predicted enzyme related to lactoylglutathione lyase
MSTSETERRHLFEHGRLSYVQIPATNVRASGDFYASVFGWEVGPGGENHLSFSDSTRAMIGAWMTDRVASQGSGVLLYIYVHGIDAILERIRARSCEIIKSPYAEGDLWVATFRDPGGNEIGIWQQGPR